MPEDIPQPVPYPWKPPVAWVTWTLVGSTVVVFLLQILELHLRGHGREDVLGNALAFSPDAFTHHHYWTLLTYAWAHAVVMPEHPWFFWVHITTNMIFLVCLGPAMEDLLGHARYLGLYLTGTIGAALVWYLLNLHADSGIVGASGAIFALVGGAGAAVPRARVRVWLLYVLPVRVRMGVLAAVVCTTELVQVLRGWMPEVAHSAHLGGAACGFLYVMFLRLVLREKYLPD